MLVFLLFVTYLKTMREGGGKPLPLTGIALESKCVGAHSCASNMLLLLGKWTNVNQINVARCSSPLDQHHVLPNKCV